MRILGVLSCRDSKSCQITESIHHRMDFGGKTTTTSVESLIDSRAMSSSGTMLMSMNVCPINHDVIHISLQGKKLKDSSQISSFLPTPESGIYSFPRTIFRHGEPLRSIQCTALRKFLMSPVGRSPRGEPSVDSIGSSPSERASGMS